MKNQYLQIFHAGLVDPTRLIEKCGSDGVIFLDGRLSLENCIKKGIEHCKINKLQGFRVCKKVGHEWGHYLTDIIKNK